MLTENQRRADFPALDSVTYLNTASIGLVPTPVVREAHEFEAKLAAAGTTGFDEDAETAVLEDARGGAARLFNAPIDSVAICTSFSEALGQVAWSLRPGRGSNIVSTDVDFPSVTYPWFRVAQETGTEVRLVPVARGTGDLDVELVARHVDRDTAAICLSHVQYLTGHRLDLAELAALAHANDALLIVDATQSAGQVPLDVTGSGVDVCIAGGYKFVCSLFGAAACYLSPAAQELLPAPLVGWRSTAEPYLLDAHYRSLAPSARQLEFSTMSYAAAVALGAAFRYLSDLDPHAVLAHNLQLSDLLIEGLRGRGARLLTPPTPECRAGIVTVQFPGRDSEQVARQLTAQGVAVSPRGGATRFSVHFYNSEAHVEQALLVLDRVLSE